MHRGRYGVPLRPWHISGFFLLFPLIVLFSIRKVTARWRVDPVQARLALFLLFCVLWVFAMVLLVDGDEANRMRISTEPYVLILAFWILPSPLWTPRPAVKMVDAA